LEEVRREQMVLPRTRLSAIIVVSLVLAMCGAKADGAKPTLVEVWCVGDDGLTQRLRDALENALKLSPDFSLSSGKKPGTLVVTIPTNVGWKQVGKRMQVLYAVEFASVDNQNIGTNTGSCWDDMLSKCAAQIVKDAKIAARKITTAEIRARTQI
jgi:hypothetical protein